MQATAQHEKEDGFFHDIGFEHKNGNNICKVNTTANGRFSGYPNPKAVTCVFLEKSFAWDIMSDGKRDYDCIVRWCSWPEWKKDSSRIRARSTIRWSLKRSGGFAMWG